jgi:hypothetical protein
LKPGAYFPSVKLAKSIFLHRTAKHKKAFLLSKSEMEKKCEGRELGEKGNWNS